MAIIGMGAIGHVVEKALADRAEIVPIDRTTSPLRSEEKPVDAAVVCVKTPGKIGRAHV